LDVRGPGIDDARVSRMRVLLTLLVATPVTAHTDVPTPNAGIAVGVNTGWLVQNGLCGSVSVGFAGHHAIRGNVAHYRYRNDNENVEESSGWFLDGSLGYVLYPRRLWSGPMMEVAVLKRRRDTVLERDPLGDEDAYTAIDTTTIAGRFLIGWTWDLDEHFFVSLAVGVSRGPETGREKVGNVTYGQDTLAFTERGVSRMTTAGEAMFRVGTMFGW
jgi:hypothetical protein